MAALFFDTSALVRRYDRVEPGVGRVRALCRRSAGHDVFLSRITSVEIASAFNRKVREGRFDGRRRNQLWLLFQSHVRQQYRIFVPDEPTFQRAEQLLFAYPLRAYDALQLAAALQVAAQVMTTMPDFRFCTADRVQAAAAQREGLTVELIA